MQLFSRCFFITFGCLCFFCSTAKNYSVCSPNGSIVYTIETKASSLFYRVSFKGKIIIDNSPLSLRFKEGIFANNLKITATTLSEATESYSLVVGKVQNVNDHYKQLLITVQQTAPPFLKLDIVIRAFNEGIAFRYLLPVWQNLSSFTLLQENTSFNLSGNPKIRALLFNNYTSSHEGIYAKMPISNISIDTLIDLPALFEYPGNIYAAITEAALVDYAGMYLTKPANTGFLVSKLSPWPADTAIKVKSLLPHKSPWRVYW